MLQICFRSLEQRAKGINQAYIVLQTFPACKVVETLFFANLRYGAGGVVPFRDGYYCQLVNGGARRRGVSEFLCRLTSDLSVSFLRR